MDSSAELIQEWKEKTYGNLIFDVYVFYYSNI